MKSTYLEAKLLFVKTIETLQKLYSVHAERTFPLVTALRDSQENVEDWLELDSDELES